MHVKKVHGCVYIRYVYDWQMTVEESNVNIACFLGIARTEVSPNDW